MGNRIALFSTSEPFDQTSYNLRPIERACRVPLMCCPRTTEALIRGRLSRRPKNEDLCQDEMTVHAALIESLLAVPNALWYSSRGFLR